jgi:hypothetical protein
MAGSRPNGKGDRPRKVDGSKYRDNYDQIVWKNKKPIDTKKPETKSP